MSKIVRWLLEWLIIGFIMGMVYYTIEGLWRIPQGGYANILMLPVGGLCGVLIGTINQIPRFYKLKIVWQSLIGTVIVLAVEFVAGCILNIWLGLGIWNYSEMPFNIMGQICLPFAWLWFLIMPFAIWVEDFLRYKLWSEGEYYTLGSVYRDLIIFK